MKKLIIVLLALILAVPVAMADDGFKELIYDIGIDLPAGEYELKLEGKSAIAAYFIMRPVDWDYEIIRGDSYLMGSTTSCTVELRDGDKLCITVTSDGDVKVTPVQKKESSQSSQTFDLNSMSLSELLALRDLITMAMWATDEWQEVTVPQGVYLVGVDIPAGTWTVRCADVNRNDVMMYACFIDWGEALSENGHSIAWTGRRGSAVVYNSSHRNFATGSTTEYSFTVQDGDYIIIETGYAPAVFTPYAGAPSLGFK